MPELGTMTRIFTLYDVLKVSRDAPPEVIRASYKALSQKHHPDRNPGDARAAAAMQKINQAYAFLSDPEKRRQHDLWVAQKEREAAKPSPEHGDQEPPWKTREDAGKQGTGNPNQSTRAATAKRFSVALFNAIKPFLIFSASVFVVFVLLPALLEQAKRLSREAPPSQSSVSENLPVTVRCTPYSKAKYKCETSKGLTTYPATPPKGAVVVNQSASSEVVNNDSQRLSDCRRLFNFIAPKVSLDGKRTPAPRGEKASTGVVYVCNDSAGNKVYKSEAEVRKSEALAEAISKASNSTSKAKQPWWSEYEVVEPAKAQEASSSKASTGTSGAGYTRPTRAPNGSPWPTKAAYIDGYAKLYAKGYSKVTVDNSENDSDVFVKLNSLDGSAKRPIRHIFIPAHQRFTMNKVNPGRYDVRYKDLDSGGMQKSEAFDLVETPIEDGIQYSDISLTLFKVRNGNMETFVISEQEF